MKTSLLIAGSLALVPMTYAQDKPNIIIILADDLGFSDLGCFGGEIHTPVLDKLAKNGVRMTQMYNSARSCPSRANLLTGLYPHQTGLGHMDGSHPAWPKGYSGFRSNSDNVTIAEVLKDAGYFTAMSGKWHLGNKSNPILRGFQEYYGLLGGFNSFWNPAVYTRLPKDRTPRHYEEGTFYATNVITDYAIDFIDQAHQEKKPLFLYLAYNAPHFPLHAPKEVTDKYMSLYMQGWDKIRDARWKRIVDLKLMQGKPELSPRGVVPESLFEDETHPLPAWDSLTKDQQTDLARRMSIFAAMVDVMDANIGRVVDELKKNGELDNTFIMFMSDNGACAEWHEFGFDKQTGVEYHTHTGAELDQMGLPGTYHHYGTGWANVCCTPFTLYKHYAHEGGISTPCITHRPFDVASATSTSDHVNGVKWYQDGDKFYPIFDLNYVIPEKAGKDATYSLSFKVTNVDGTPGFTADAAALTEINAEADGFKLVAIRNASNVPVRTNAHTIIKMNLYKAYSCTVTIVDEFTGGTAKCSYRR